MFCLTQTDCKNSLVVVGTYVNDRFRFKNVVLPDRIADNWKTTQQDTLNIHFSETKMPNVTPWGSVISYLRWMLNVL